MNNKQIIEELKSKYPGKYIVGDENSDEIICEIEPTSDHKEYSSAIAIFDEITPHVHHKSIETYEVLQGKMTLWVDEIKYELEVGDVFTINPGQVHKAKGNQTWIFVTSKPGWRPEDHIIKI